MSGHTVTRLIAFLVTRVLKTMSRSHLSVLLDFVYPFLYLVNQGDLYFKEYCWAHFVTIRHLIASSVIPWQSWRHSTVQKLPNFRRGTWCLAGLWLDLCTYHMDCAIDLC
jgi:hypothetical protein